MTTASTVRSGGPATITLHSCNESKGRDIWVREFTVSDVKPHAQYERSVSIRYKRPRKKLAESLTVCESYLYVTIADAGGKIVYDSRDDVPVDMDKWNASRDSQQANRDRYEASIREFKAEQSAAAEVAIPEPAVAAMPDRAYAENLDERLRSRARAVAHGMERFRPLIEEARTRQIHLALGFKSWTGYIADVIGKEMKALPVDDRRQIVGLLAGEGMSQRAIADAVGVSQKTVDRDLEHQVSRGDSPGSRFITVVRGDSTSHDDLRNALTGSRDPHRPTVPVEVDREQLAANRELVRQQLGREKIATVTGIDGKRYPVAPKQGRDKPKPKDSAQDRKRRLPLAKELQRLAESLQESVTAMNALTEADEVGKTIHLSLAEAREIIAALRGAGAAIA